MKSSDDENIMPADHSGHKSMKEPEMKSGDDSNTNKTPADHSQHKMENNSTFSNEPQNDHDTHSNH
jgi:hypothetical protein